MTETDIEPAVNEATPSDNVVELPKQERGEAQAKVTDFVREHPLLVVAGGIAMGVVVAALLPKGTTRRLARRATGLAEAASAAGMLLGTRVRDTAEATGAGLRERGGAVADRLEKLHGTASEKFGQIGNTASAQMERLIDPVETAAGRVAKKAAELRSRTRR